MRYCPDCGAPVERRVPPGEDRPRAVCPACGRVHYTNPLLVVGCLPVWEERVLLCRRAIEPRGGFWTLPAGFMEEGETPEEGACREAWEEARARVELTGLLAVYGLKHIDQVQLFWAARLLDPHVSAGPESLEVGLFPWERIPWDGLAFPSVHWVLRHWERVRGQACWAPDRTPPAP